MRAAASCARASIGSNDGQSTGSSVSSVAMISPSSLGTFWVLYPWMNPPPRSGISRESGSVMLRTGPGPLRFFSRSAALRSASAARALAASSLAWACLTRQWSSTPATSGRAAGRGGAARPLPLLQLRQLGRPAPPGPGPGSPPPSPPPPGPAAARSAARSAAAPGTPPPGPPPPPPRRPLPFQLSQRSADPLIPPPGPPRILRHLIPAPARPEQLILGRIGRGMRGDRLRASLASPPRSGSPPSTPRRRSSSRRARRCPACPCPAARTRSAPA